MESFLYERQKQKTKQNKQTKYTKTNRKGHLEEVETTLGINEHCKDKKARNNILVQIRRASAFTK